VSLVVRVGCVILCFVFFLCIFSSLTFACSHYFIAHSVIFFNFLADFNLALVTIIFKGMVQCNLSESAIKF